MEDKTKAKQIAGQIESIADALEEIAITEAGETDDYQVARVCAYLYAYCHFLRTQAFRKRNGIPMNVWPPDSDIPF